MAWAPDYASAAELKHYLSPGIADTVDDAEIALALTAASRAIDHATNRQFGQAASAVARVYTPGSAGRRRVVIDDLMTTTGLVIQTDTNGDGSYATTLTLDTEVVLWPPNAAADGRPWTALIAAPGGLGLGPFPCGENYVKVTAKWGWTAVPAEVKQACLIQASRLFKRKDSPFGIAGSPEMGSELRLLQSLDPDVAVLVSGVRRWWAAA